MKATQNTSVNLSEMTPADWQRVTEAARLHWRIRRQEDERLADQRVWPCGWRENELTDEVE